MQHRIVFACLLCLGMGTLLLQCGDDSKAGPGEFCDVDDDCSGGLICRNNICIRENAGDCNPECSPGQVCFEGRCETVGDPNDKDGDGSPAAQDCDDFNPGIHPGAYEYCDGVDNDCDNQTDEDCVACAEGSSQDCGTDLGECTLGIHTCTGGRWEPCSGTGPAPEICDQKDDDCDGMTDEVCPCTDGDQFPCGADSGSCSAGVQNCENGSWTGCSGQLPQPETCDGNDNDCDGLTDEGFNLGAECLGEGECGKGSVECASELDTRCSSMPGGSNDRSTGEVCDEKDNDCDGLTDEELEADQAQDSCNLALDLGGLPDNGSQRIVTGNLWPPGDEDWYKVTATDDVTEDLEDGCDMFHFHAIFMHNPNAELMIDVYIESCDGASTVCTDSDEYEHNYNGQFPGEFPTGQCPCTAEPEEGATVCTAENRVFLIRVHGPNPSCDNYQLLITNGPQ